MSELGKTFRHLDSYISGEMAFLEEADRQGYEERIKQQVNARISADHYFLLGKLAEKFGKSRAGMAAEILESAIIDAWRLADMPSHGLPDDFTGYLPGIYEGDELYNEYRDFMYSLGVRVHGYEPEDKK